MSDFCYRHDGPDDVRIVPMRAIHITKSRYAEGYEAASRWWVYREGDEPGNPYTPGSFEATTWEKGWSDASDDYDARS